MTEILIKGLTLPKDGFYNLTIDKDGNVLKKEEIGYHAFSAIEVPTHGRLINADDVLKRAEFLLKRDVKDENLALAIAFGESLMGRIIIPASEKEPYEASN